MRSPTSIYPNTAKLHPPSMCPTISGPLVSDTPPNTTPEPLKTDGQLAFMVRAILNTHRREGGLEYLTDREGYIPEEQCWIFDCCLFKSFTQDTQRNQVPIPERIPLPELAPQGGWDKLCHISTEACSGLCFPESTTVYKHDHHRLKILKAHAHKFAKL